MELGFNPFKTEAEAAMPLPRVATKYRSLPRDVRATVKPKGVRASRSGGQRGARLSIRPEHVIGRDKVKRTSVALDLAEITVDINRLKSEQKRLASANLTAKFKRNRRAQITRKIRNLSELAEAIRHRQITHYTDPDTGEERESGRKCSKSTGPNACKVCHPTTDTESAMAENAAGAMGEAMSRSE